MKKTLITGASGMVGSIVLRECLNSTEVEQVTSIVRRASGITHPKLIEVIHQDFGDFSSIENHFANQDVAHFCVGVYSGTVPKDTLKLVTFDFAKIFGDAVKKNSPQATLCFLSGQGADLKEKSWIPFAKFKGMAENHLMSLDLGGLYIFRPGYIYPVKKREEPSMMYQVSRSLYPLLNKVAPAMSITSENLGKAMFKAGIQGAQKTILENQDIKEV